MKEFSYYPRDFALFELVYKKVMGEVDDYKKQEARAKETFSLAADQGYLPALLELKATKWGYNIDSYGFAVQLRPFVGKGDKTLDYYFGRALKNGTAKGSQLYYEGLYWMENSLGIPVKYPEEGQTFEAFVRYYTECVNLIDKYYEHDGFLHFRPSVVLAPSKKAWETFKLKKVIGVKIAESSSYMFKYDSEQIEFLANKYNIRVFQKNGFEDTSRLCKDHEDIDEISVRKDTFEIVKTFKDPEIQPIIEFIENVMIRSGSAYSAISWLRQMGCRYI